MRQLSGLVLVFTVCMFTGCATMGKNECLHAEWYSIGFEDGARGYQLSRIGEHRKACAEYNVVPDFNIYAEGHRQGVVEWCTAKNGYRQGLRGQSYNGVCPENLEDEFLLGFDQGKQEYGFNREIDKHNNSISSLYQELDRVEEDIEYLEAELIRDGVSPGKRKMLLEKIRTAEWDRDGLIREINDLELLVNELQNELADIKKSGDYQP